ncbi:MAG: PTS sugar transporter subunit IIA [Proteobacteria bacterium]|nr:helix-turn-helix domain-containing protein [Desulfobacula sp.]MBU3951521.1 PTS sugar transporter subunit IIA [Pseudomonadota bacterium]MBU4133498.1 PTS sugar transporter subunit IIA [Pseudomonadota bacterium]
MELSIFDLSKHLGVVPDTIERWVRQGKLPVSKTGSNYRFRASELQKWASKHNISLNISDKKVPEKKNEAGIPLSHAVQNGGVYYDLLGEDVKSVLNASLERISKIPKDFKPDLLDRLMEREQALSTGIGNGIAIPHPRVPLGYLNEPLVAVCFLENPVDYQAMDQQPVKVLFLILCPDLKFHLHLLSALSFCLRDKSFVQFLNSCPDPGALIEKIDVLQNLNPL